MCHAPLITCIVDGDSTLLQNDTCSPFSVIYSDGLLMAKPHLLPSNWRRRHAKITNSVGFSRACAILVGFLFLRWLLTLFHLCSSDQTQNWKCRHGNREQSRHMLNKGEGNTFDLLLSSPFLQVVFLHFGKPNHVNWCLIKGNLTPVS